ncbi:periplasmic binding protein-like II [Cytidiella melzeri]|nr:periplasmic binding protein-like II [Cytidiella melzeri]
MVLRVGYVREHFSSPLLQYAEADQGKTFVLVECPSGTGQLIGRLQDNQIDVAIALTDPLIAGIAKGSDAYKLVGSYVETPLNWAVITGKESKYHSISDLRDTTIGISRIGSGSQTMAYVMALQQKWPTENLKFQINNDIRGLIDSVNDNSTSAFMWEWFTTKPYQDSGEVRFIGSVPTPWPSWMIAASTDPERAPNNALSTFLYDLTTYVRAFDSDEKRAKDDVEFIKEKFGYPEEDVVAWLKTVKYPADCAKISSKVLADTLSVLEQAGFVKKPEAGFDLQTFVNPAVAVKEDYKEKEHVAYNGSTKNRYGHKPRYTITPQS